MDLHSSSEVEVVDRPVSISHLVHKLHAYAPVIVLSTAAIVVLYLIGSIAIYTLSPAQRITSQKFRLEFEGASEGKYPNGLTFSSSDITSTPILRKVYNADHLERFTTFDDFSHSLFVLESNLEYERLAAEYQARIADPKQSVVDRERVVREWQAKSAALAKNELSLNWLRTRRTDQVPESLVQKVLIDTLSGWARYAATEQHVLKYQLTILSPDMVGASEAENEPIVAIQVLRSKIYQIGVNIDALREVPGSELIRSAEGMSLADIRLRLEEIVRFRLEPLSGRIGSGGMITNRAATLRFLESQLAYDQRHLKSIQDGADVIRQSFAVYALDQRGFTPENSSKTAPAAGEQPRTQQQRSDTLMPQISDSFLDRLMTLTSQSSDVQYRQKLVDDYRRASLAVIPAQEAVSYDQQVLSMVKLNSATAAASEADSVRNEIAAIRNEVRQLLVRVNNIYDGISANLSPSKELYTLTAPPVVRTEHSRSLSQMALYGIALIAFAVPVIIVLCLIHARIREEEATEAGVAASELEPA
jgi:hypothetical protein